MSIPRIIHYCWFGRNPKPKLANKCINSWKKYCPDYEIIEWNEDNFDVSACPLYVRQAYEAKMWAFVTDYARLKIVYENGGVYLDTDVELIKPLDPLLKYNAYFGFEDGVYINTGLGFGAIKSHLLIKKLMDDYNDTSFLNKGKPNPETCPVKNTRIFVQHGLKQDNSLQTILDAIIFPSEYFCPYNGCTKTLNITSNTVSIHWFDGSWGPKESQKKRKYYQRQARCRNTVHTITHLPNYLLKKILGECRYQKLKRRLGRY